MAFILADFIYSLQHYSVDELNHYNNSFKNGSCDGNLIRLFVTNMALTNLHWYTKLATFFWMLLEGGHLFLLMFSPLNSRESQYGFYLLVGWVTPALPAFIWGLLMHIECGGLPEYCGRNITIRDEICQTWGLISNEHVKRVIKFNISGTDYKISPQWVIRTPIFAILLVNLAIMLKLLIIIIQKTRLENRDLPKADQENIRVAKVTIVLLPLLGLNFILLPYVPDCYPVLEILQVILSNSQGIFIAFFYCFINNDIRRHLGRIVLNWQNCDPDSKFRKIMTFFFACSCFLYSSDKEDTKFGNVQYRPVGRYGFLWRLKAKMNPLCEVPLNNILRLLFIFLKMRNFARHRI